MELIVEDAEFVTMAPGNDAKNSGAESMLVRDGRIAAIGPAVAVRAAAEPGAAVVRLDGATVIPGLIDAHCHVINIGYLAAGADCSQPAAPDIAAIKARLRAAAQVTPAGSWVTGSGYVEYKLAEQRHPTRADLDAAVPDRPAVVYHTSLHACVLNSAALREAGFADGQPDPPDGVIGRDGQGRAQRPAVRGADVPGARGQAARRPRAHGRGRAGAGSCGAPGSGWRHWASPRPATRTCAARRSPRTPRPMTRAR